MIARRIASLWLVLLALSGCASKTAQPPGGDDQRSALYGAIMMVTAWQKAADLSHSHDLTPLLSELKTLKAAAVPGQTDDTATATLFYIGVLEHLIVVEQMLSNQPIDRAMAQDALLQFNIVLAHHDDIPEWHVSMANANYFAGNTAQMINGSANDIVLGYWNACARMGHPGCVNNIAAELLKKPEPSDDDIRNALGLYAGVVKTGTLAECAGLFSARTSANLMHFTGVRLPGNDEIKSLETASALYRQLQDESHARDPCDGGAIGVDQYMMQADRAQHDVTLLDTAGRQSTSRFWVTVASYLRGTTTQAEYDGVIAKSGPNPTCGFQFYAAWKAHQAGRTAEADARYEAMSKLPAGTCDQEIMLMRRYLKKARTSG